MAKSEIEFAAEQAEKMTELLRNGILVAINEDNTYLYSDVVDYMIAHGATIPVRCKDCKWYKEGKYLAPNKFCYRLKDRSGEHIGYNYSDDDFCSYGERKDNV